MRVGDSEREQVAAMLRDACAAGRLTIDELDQRLAHVLDARTASDLEQQLADLPTPEPLPKQTGRRVFWPGIAPFHERRRLRAPVPSAFEEAVREIVPRMAMAGYHLIDELPPRRLIFSSGTGERVTLMLHPNQAGGTDVSAFGHAPRAIRKAFAELRD